jgi:predicted RNase H-like nuclease
MDGELRCFGIDLAWSDRNRTGAAVIDGAGRLLDEELLGNDDEVVAWIEGHLAGAAVIAVDAPLLVPNENGARDCEREIASHYGSRKIGAHPSNRSRFLRTLGRIRGEDLAAVMAEWGFVDPWAGGERVVLEVYPHPGHIEVFGLPERILYKKGDVGSRRAGLRTLSGHLAGLANADPPFRAAPIEIGHDIGGRALKGLEDRLDARFCAWTALVWARYGTKRFRLFGDPEEGHIAVPLPATSSGTSASP